MAILLEIPDAKYRGYIPENFNECNKSQYIAISRIIYAYHSKKISLDDLAYLGTYALLGIKAPKKPKKIGGQSAELENADNIYRLSELLFNPEKENGLVYLHEGAITINQNYENNPIASFKIFSKYKGPNAYLKNSTFGQYVDGLGCIYNFETTKDPKELLKLLALFYWPWPKKAHGNIKDKTLNKRMEDFSFVDPGIVYGFYLFFTGFQIYLNQTKILYAGQELNFRILFESLDNFKSRIPGIGMKSLVYSIAESGVYGNQEQVRNTNLWEILVKLYDSKKAALDEKERTEKLNKQ